MQNTFGEPQVDTPWHRRFPSKGSLRSQIIAWSFVPTAIILVLAALVSLCAYQRLTKNLVINRDRDVTRLSAELVPLTRRSIVVQ